jgi:hypothetical protein
MTQKEHGYDALNRLVSSWLWSGGELTATSTWAALLGESFGFTPAGNLASAAGDVYLYTDPQNSMTRAP